MKKNMWKAGNAMKGESWAKLQRKDKDDEKDSNIIQDRESKQKDF